MRFGDHVCRNQRDPHHKRRRFIKRQRQVTRAMVTPPRNIIAARIAIETTGFCHAGICRGQSSQMHVRSCIVSATARRFGNVIHLGERIGRQVVSCGDQSVQYELCREVPVRKKIA